MISLRINCEYYNEELAELHRYLYYINIVFND